MKLKKHFFNKLLHHPDTPVWTLICTMVAIMASYNTVIRYGFSEKMFLRILIVYPLIVIFIYCLRTFVTLPIVLKLHNYFPNIIKINVPVQVSIPLLVIWFNVSIMMVLFTFIHHTLYPHFLIGYIGNWIKTFFVAVPIFFFVTKPLIFNMFDLLRANYPLIIYEKTSQTESE